MHLKQLNGLLASYLDNFEAIAEEVDTKATTDDNGYLEQTANRLKANVRSLRKVHSFLLPDVPEYILSKWANSPAIPERGPPRHSVEC